jgi:dTDP-4-amino-4,6-dideoxygalactose transaminase
MRLRYCGVAKSGFEASDERSSCWWEYDIAACYPKMIPNDVCAAIGLAQLRKLDANQQRRKAIWDHYQRALVDLACLSPPVDAGPKERHSHFTYAVGVVSGARDRLVTYLYDRGIYTTLRFHPLHLNRVYGSRARLPVCERLNAEGLSLPLHPHLSDEDVSTVVETVRAFSPGPSRASVSRPM